VTFIESFHSLVKNNLTTFLIDVSNVYCMFDFHTLMFTNQKTTDFSQMLA